MRKIAIGFATAVLLASAALAQDDMAVLNFIVIRDYSGKPVRNASVVMHPVEKNGKQSKRRPADQDRCGRQGQL